MNTVLAYIGDAPTCRTCGATVEETAWELHKWWHLTMAGTPSGPRPVLP